MAGHSGGMRRKLQLAGGVSAVALAGLFAGAVTAYLQGVLPASWNTVANSGAVWTVVAVALAVPLARSREVAATAGLAALAGEVGGYYGYVEGVRHVPIWLPAAILWAIAALWVGPLAGLAAHFVRWGSPGWRCTALVALCGVVAGEGGYLVRVAGVARAGWVEITLGCAGALAALVTLPGAPRGRLGAAGAGVLAGVAVYAAYSQPIIW